MGQTTIAPKRVNARSVNVKISKEQLRNAAEEGIISNDQVDDLFSYLKSQPETSPAFSFSNILYYFVGLVAIGAMTLFMNSGWEEFGGWGILFISIAYAGIGLVLVGKFQQAGHAIPAGICATFVVAITPLAIYGFQQGIGLWPDDTTYHEYIKWHWIYLELGTLIVGTIMTWKYRYPFLVMQVAVTLWYMSMDFSVMLTGGEYDYEFSAFFSIWFGLLTIFIAFWVDIRSRKTGDYAFWLYIFGVIVFWCGLSMQHSDSELYKFIYFCINLGLIGIGAVLVRKVFVVFGAFGCARYFVHMASTIFQ